MKILNLTLTVTVLVISSSANAHLISRLGGQAYFNDEANLTWLADANYAATQYANSGGTVGDADGLMTWAEATSWAANLVVDGVSGWRLANTVDVGNDGPTFTNVYQGVDYGYNITAASELSNMFFNVLGNKAFFDTNGTATGCAAAPDYCLSNTGPFSNIQSFIYWSATEYAPYTTSTWNFNMGAGLQLSSNKTDTQYAWAVQPGDVSAVPVPAAVWLFASGLIGLTGLARRN